MRKYVVAALCLGGLTSCGDIPTAPLPLRPTAASRDAGPVYIPGRYIVRFKPSAGPDALSNAVAVRSSYGGSIDRVYTSALNGAAMQLADDAAAALLSDPRVLSVEQDQVISKHTVQLNPTWGLDRIDQRTRSLSSSYTYAGDGGGVTVYILDSGINFGQGDFGGRAVTGYDAITAGGNAADCDGHGTHVAGTVGSSTYGVAKNVRLVAVRVLDCAGNGTMSSVLAGVDWVTTNKVLPAVANMSLGGSTNSTVNLAVENSIAAGITYVVSAGNSGVDACTQSPASAPSVISVAATDASDAFAGFSNFGSCVEMLAPGVSITSWWTGNGTNTISGTSMASPHVAGVAALYLQANPTATPAQVRSALMGNATASAASGVPAGTPNLLLYSGFIAAPARPVANFTFSCTGNSCSFDGSSSTSAWPTATYLWNFGDSSGSNTKTASHTYAANGTYTVSLTVTDPNGSSTKTASVVLNHAPSASISAPAAGAVVALGAAVNFAGSATDLEDGALSGASLVWTSSIDGPIGTGATFSKSSLSGGVHTITLTARDAQGATGVATQTLTINRPPSVTISTPLSNSAVVAGASATFTGAANDPEDGALTGPSLTWRSNLDGVLGTGASLSTSTLSVGAHVITLTASDAQGNTGVATINFTVNPPPNQAPVARFTWSCPTLQCTMDASTSTDDVGIVRYSWTWGDGRSESKVSSITRNTWAAPATYTVTLTVTDAGGLTNSVTRQVPIPNKAPVASISAPVTGRVATFGSAVAFTGSATDAEDGALGGTSLTWTSSIDGIIGTGASITTSTLSAGTHTVTLTAKDALGATGTASVTVTIDRPPVPTITAPANNSSVVQGATVTLTGGALDAEDGALAGAALTWTSSIDGPIGTGASVSTNALSVGTHVITLAARDAQNVSATTSVTLVVAANRPPIVAIATPQATTTIPFGSSVTFTGNATDPEDGVLSGPALTWASSIDGPIGTGTSFSLTTLSIGTHVITLTAHDALNATASASVTIVIAANQAPVATITAPAANASFVRGTPIAFAGSGADAEDGALAGASLVWTSSLDGTIGTGTSFSTSALSVGTHVITLTAKDALNATGTATRTIVVTAVAANQPPVARFTWSCPTLQCSMDASTSTDDVGIVKYTWTWGDGRSESRSAPLARNTWAAAGTYTITLTVTDGGGLTNTVSRQVSIPNQPPVAAIAAPAPGSVFTIGAVVAFTGSGTDPEDGALSGASLTWTSSVDGPVGSGASFSTSTLSAGTHTITLTARDALGAVGTATRSIVVNRPPTALISAPGANTAVVQGTAVAFAGSASDPEDGALAGASLAWTSSLDGALGNGTSFSTSSLSLGAHVITLTATDSRGASTSASVVLTVAANHPPIANITAPASGSVVAVGASVSLTGSGSDAEDGALSGTSLSWTSSLDGSLGTGATITTSSLSAGTHVITLTARDALNATGSATITLIVNRAPTASISAPASGATVAQGAAVSFAGSASDPEDGALSGASLVWTSSRDGQIGTGTSFSSSTLSAGTHLITLTARDNRNATATASVSITIVANQPPVASISAPANNATVQSGASVSFAGTGVDPEDGSLSGSSLTWTSSLDGAIGTGGAFSTAGLRTGVHTITLTARDSRNATGTATIVLTVVSNQPPTAQISAPASNATVQQGASVSFAGSGSDPEDGALTGSSLTWTSSLDGVIGTGASFATAGLRAGVHTITLTARDSRNATGTATVVFTVTAGNQAPVAAITAPTSGSLYLAGTSVTFSGTGTDAEDGALAGASLMWTSSINGQIGTGTSFSTTGLRAGTHTITLTATDSRGATGVATISVTIKAPLKL